MTMIRTLLAGACLTAGLSAGAAALAADAKSPPPPCSGEAYKALDFWTGEWTAILPAGAPLPSGGVAETDVAAAAAAVSPILDGCVYLEEWDSVPFANGQVSRGKGFHRYDSASGQWRQIWVSNSGRENISIGTPFEGGMRYASERPGADGAVTLSRQTIVPMADGAVRNYSETSADSGKTWTMSYDFIYRRK
ncbi:MAG: hypothetical protein R3C58_01355 [Parvularculaceae bacterium]